MVRHHGHFGLYSSLCVCKNITPCMSVLIKLSQSVQTTNSQLGDF
jgi:hypothetical protein